MQLEVVAMGRNTHCKPPHPLLLPSEQNIWGNAGYILSPCRMDLKSVADAGLFWIEICQAQLSLIIAILQMADGRTEAETESYPGPSYAIMHTWDLNHILPHSQVILLVTFATLALMTIGYRVW